MNLEELKASRRATITCDELAQLLGVARGTAYEAVRRGDVPSWRVGRRILVLVPGLLKLLGDDTWPLDETDD